MFLGKVEYIELVIFKIDVVIILIVLLKEVLKNEEVFNCYKFVLRAG